MACPRVRVTRRERLRERLRDTSALEDLRQRFGADNVKVEELVAIEDQITGIVIFPDDPLRRAEIFTRDVTTLRGIVAIRVSGSKSRWHLDNGFHLGMTLAELVKRNGKPITYYGLAWDYGGIVTDWHGGRLAQSPDGPIHRSIGLSSADNAGVDAVPLGEGEFRSDDPRYPHQGKLVIVGELRVSFAEPEEKLAAQGAIAEGIAPRDVTHPPAQASFSAMGCVYCAYVVASLL